MTAHIRDYHDTPAYVMTALIRHYHDNPAYDMTVLIRHYHDTLAYDITAPLVFSQPASLPHSSTTDPSIVCAPQVFIGRRQIVQQCTVLYTEVQSICTISTVYMYTNYIFKVECP
jgi:hypothetical protein